MVAPPSRPPGSPVVLATVLGIVAVAAVMALRTRSPRRPSPSPTADVSTAGRVQAAPDRGPFWFEEVTKGSGVDFTYRNGEEAGHRTILESLGGGVALFDYDGDGRTDLFFPGGGQFIKEGERFRVDGKPGRLYRNEGGWRFADVTAKAGLDGISTYGHGASSADYDGDGDPDLLVTSYEGTILFRNEGGGRFTDVTEAAGLTGGGWSTGAAWADFDGDGRLDLYVARYVDWLPENHPSCRYRYSGEIDVCAPSNFNGLTDALYRNEGDGRFVEVGRPAGLVGNGKGLGVVACDLDDDGDVDLYVANDTTPNFLYRNRGDGTFDEVGYASGAALSAEGIATGSMGVDAADADGDGDPDLWVSNYEGETNELYLNDGQMQFTPAGMGNGLGPPSRPLVGWGTGLRDLDRDGRLDAFITNGHLMHHLPRSPLAQRPLLFHQEPDGRFAEADTSSGPYFATPHAGRGCAFGDLDDDGDLDLVVVHQNEPVALLRNDSTPAGPALRLRLRGAGRRAATGARVAVQSAGRTIVRWLVGGGSYLSQDDPRLLIGLGAGGTPERVEITWPGGRVDRHEGLAADRPWLVREGEAPAPDLPTGSYP